jgi:hypothetical protein
LDGYALPQLKTRLGYQRPKKMEETLQKKWKSLLLVPQVILANV